MLGEKAGWKGTGLAATYAKVIIITQTGLLNKSEHNHAEKYASSKNERKHKPHKAPVSGRILSSAKQSDLADKTRQWGSVRGVWRSRKKAAQTVTIQEAKLLAGRKVTIWAGPMP